MDLERFAALSAELESGASREELCAREKISTETFAFAEELWMGRMADEVARKRFDLTNRYNAAFVRKRRALDAGKHGPPRKTRTPTSAPPRASTSTPSRDEDATLDTNPAGKRPALPFAPAPALAHEHEEQADRTLDLVEPAPPVNPFRSMPGSPAEAFARARAHAELVQGLARPPRGDDEGHTADLGRGPGGPALPFRSAPRENADTATSTDDGDDPTTPMLALGKGHTRPLLPALGAAQGGQAPPSLEPELSLEQYAAACAEMPTNSARAAAVRAKYGIPSAEAWTAMSKRWEARMQADPRLFRRLMELVAELGKSKKGV